MKAFIFIILHFSLLSQNPLFIEQNHRVYSFLHRMEAKGFISIASVQPFTEGYIKRKLVGIKNKSLSDSEVKCLQSFDNEFFKENTQKKVIQEIWTGDGFSHSWKSIFTSGFNVEKESFVFYQGKENFLVVNIKLFSELMYRNSTASLIGSEYGFFGKFRNVYFSVRKQEYSVKDKENTLLYHSRFLKNYWTNNTIKTRIFNSGDHSRGYIAFQTKNILLHLGRVPFAIGFGESGKFALNGFQTSIPTSIGFSFDFWKIRYQGLHVSLTAPELGAVITDTISSSLNNTYRKIPDKFLVSHRFELDIFTHFQIHYNELIIYGNRSIDLNYLNPLSFLRPIEHELGDRDNALITLGFKWKVPKYHLMTYHDILLDEWKISKVFSNWYGNKHGILNGLTWANYNFQAWFEHVSIRPFTYSHKFDVNRYTHDGQNLGYFSGPNSQVFYYKLAYFPTPEWKFWISHRIMYKGLNYDGSNLSSWNIGGNIFKGHTNVNTGSIKSITENVKFLSGNIQTEREIQINITFEPNHYIKTEMNYSYNNFDKNLLRFYLRIQY